MYEETVSYWENRVQEFGLSTISHLSIITMLKKICNHPELVLNKNLTSDSTEVCKIENIILNVKLKCLFFRKHLVNI